MNHTLPAPLDVKLMNWTASALFVGLALGALAAGAWWVLRYPGFAVSRIVVHGDLVHNNAVTLRANVAPHLAGNFFTVDLRAAPEAQVGDAVLLWGPGLPVEDVAARAGTICYELLCGLTQRVRFVHTG